LLKIQFRKIKNKINICIINTKIKKIIIQQINEYRIQKQYEEIEQVQIEPNFFNKESKKPEKMDERRRPAFSRFSGKASREALEGNFEKVLQKKFAPMLFKVQKNKAGHNQGILEKRRRPENT